MTKEELKTITESAFNNLLTQKYSSEELIKQITLLSEENQEELNPNQFAMFLFYQNIEFTKDYLDKVLEEVLLKDIVKYFIFTKNNLASTLMLDYFLEFLIIFLKFTLI